MRAKDSKALVIDASVARAAGGADARDARAVECHEFLNEVYKVCHRLVWTPEIIEEWNRHQSGYFKSWRAKMVQKGKVFRPEGQEPRISTRKLQRRAKGEVQLEEMLKDVHLLEAALAADNIIVSLDDEAKALFDAALAEDSAYRQVRDLWLRPREFFEKFPLNP